MARLLSLNVGLARDITWQGKRVHATIWRAPVHGRPILRRLNIDSDANQQRRQAFQARSAPVAGLAFLEARRRDSRNYVADAPSGGACVRRFERSAPVSSFARAPEPDPAIHPCWSRRRGARCRVAHHLPRHRGSRTHAWFRRIPSRGQPTALRLAKGEMSASPRENQHDREQRGDPVRLQKICMAVNCKLVRMLRST